MKWWGIWVIVFLLYGLTPVKAVSVTITNVPSEVTIGNPFTLTAVVSGLVANFTYYTKIRIGQTSSDMNKSQTNNPLNDSSQDWLSDTDAWSTFPQITSDSSGNWNGSVIGRPGNTAIAGTNLVVLRIRKTDGSTNYDSGAFSFNVNPASSPTPSPSPLLTPTPSPSPTPTPNDYSNLFISEYIPYPDSGNEWVEIYNGNDFEVNLYGWFVDDIADSGSAPIDISGIISAKAYKQFYLSDSFLNNNGDDVRLLNGSKTEKNKTSFSISTKTKSWSKDSAGNWCQVDSTPNSSNPNCPTPAPTSTPTPLPTPKPSPTPSISPPTLPPLTVRGGTEEGDIKETPAVLSSSTQRTTNWWAIALIIVGGIVFIVSVGLIIKQYVHPPPD